MAIRSRSTARAPSGEAQKQNLDKKVTLAAPRRASREELLRFHDEKHVSWVETRSRIGTGYLDYGDTPAFPGVLEAASAVTGSGTGRSASNHGGRSAAHVSADRRHASRAPRPLSRVLRVQRPRRGHRHAARAVRGPARRLC